MDRIRQCAQISVGRGVSFGLLAVGTITISFIWDPLLAVRAAAILLTLQAAVLWLLGEAAFRVHYRRREVWLLLDRQHGLPEERAQQVISNIMRDTLHTFARHIGVAAGAMWAFDVAGRVTRLVALG